MLTINIILKELKNVPVSRFEDLYSILRSFRANRKKSQSKNKKILSYAGCFGDLSEDEYNSLISNNVRNSLNSTHTSNPLSTESAY